MAGDLNHSKNYFAIEIPKLFFFLPELKVEITLVLDNVFYIMDEVEHP
jgi:hypothetical protein